MKMSFWSRGVIVLSVFCDLPFMYMMCLFALAPEYDVLWSIPFSSSFFNVPLSEQTSKISPLHGRLRDGSVMFTTLRVVLALLNRDRAVNNGDNVLSQPHSHL